MEDIIGVSIDKLEEEILMLKRNVASWRSFGDGDKALPIVTYRGTYNGVDTLEISSDLSKLTSEAQVAISDNLSEWHGSMVIQGLEQLIKVAANLKSELLSGAEPVAPEEPADEFSS